MRICKGISLEDRLSTIVLTFKNGRKLEELRIELPPQRVLERDDEGRPVRTEGPYRDGKLKASVIRSCIDEAMRHFLGPGSVEEAERLAILFAQVDTFPGRVKGNDMNMFRVLEDIRSWAGHLMASNIDAFVLRRSLLRTFNSFASGSYLNDAEPTDD
jgi:hypothetical protein